MEKECDNACPEMIVKVDTKPAAGVAKFEDYDFPTEPPKPAIPPRAPRGTLTKRNTSSTSFL